MEETEEPQISPFLKKLASTGNLKQSLSELTYRTKRAGKSNRIIAVVPLSAESLHRTRFSQVMERTLLLHVDV
jgi:hypothetical protein